MLWYIIPGIVLFDLAFTAFLFWAIIAVAWKPWMRAYPPQEPAPDSVRREFQSYRFGVLNFGYCIHTEADESYLHLTPAAFLRFFGAGPISIPWTSVRLLHQSRRGRWATARIDGKTVMGPAWSLTLAEPDDEDIASRR
jgi:hypothetical protein